MADPIRILLVDDHPVVLDGLAAMLTTQRDFEVVGRATTGGAAVYKADSLNPDVIVTDLEMPGMDGVEAIREIRKANESIEIVVLTAFDSDDRIIEAVEAGAQGYLLKGSPRDEIFDAVRTVSAGGALLPPVVASRLLSKVRAPKELDALTPREEEVLELVAEGCSNAEIGERLYISERTVKFHVSSILAKLQAKNRTEAVWLARESGLL